MSKSTRDAIKFLINASYNGAESKFKNQITTLKNEKQLLENKIADLEAKLAESQKKHLLDETEWQDYCAFKHIEPQIKGCLDREREYKNQLAKEQKHISRLKNMNKSHDEAVGRLTEENNELKQQLAEKEKEIKSLNLEAQKYFEDAYCNDFHNQDKISFAVEKLQEVKEWLDKMLNGWRTNQEVHPYQRDGIRLALENVEIKIDNQIKQLKEGK